MPTGTHAALRLILSELKALKVAEVGEDTDVEGLCHFAAIVPKGGKL